MRFIAPKILLCLFVTHFLAQSLAQPPSAFAGSASSPASQFMHYCQNPGENTEIDVTIDALKYAAGEQDCTLANDRLNELTWLQLDHPDLVDLRVINDYSQVSSLAILSEQAPKVEQLKTASKLPELSYLRIYAPIKEFALERSALRRLDITGAAGLKLIDMARHPQLTEVNIVSSELESVEQLGLSTQLISLRLTFSELADVSWLSGLTKLEHGYFDGNSLTVIPDLSRLKALTRLSLSRNALTDLSPLAPLAARLDDVRVSHNPLADLSQLEWFADARSLSVAGLGLKNLDFLGSCAQLEDIDAGANALVDISALARCTKLQFGYFLGNSLVEVADLSPLVELKNLDLSSNKITTLAGLPANLFDLRLEDNPLASLEFMALQPLPALYRLKLSRTAITDLSPLRHAPNISQLTIDDGILKSFAGLDQLRRLRTISADFNQVTELSALKDMTQLTSLSLLGNQLEDVSALASLSKLVFLDLYSNPLGDTIAKTEANCPTQTANSLLNQWCLE